MDNYSAELGNTYKENCDYENQQTRAYIDNKSTIRFENHSGNYHTKAQAPTFKPNTLSNASGVSSIKSQMMKYRKVKCVASKYSSIGTRNGSEVQRETTGYSNALLRFRNLKQVPSTFR